MRRKKKKLPKYRSPFVILAYVTWNDTRYTVKKMENDYPYTFSRYVEHNPHYQWTRLREEYARTGDKKFLVEMLGHVSSEVPLEDLDRKTNGKLNLIILRDGWFTYMVTCSRSVNEISHR